VRLPRYPIYKASGVQWLGTVPSHWEVLRLKHKCEVFPSNVDKQTREDEPSIRLCNYTDVYYNERITPDLGFMEATASPDQIARFTLKAGDTIITKDSETADDIAIAAYVPQDLPGIVCGYHLSLVRPRLTTSGAFVKRAFDSLYAKARFAVAANGLTRVGLSQYALDNVELPFPPFEEQEAIAAFLDRETAKIDALIAEQEKLIALLAEKRKAAISHAVTKGLAPKTPMKDSGVAWLGHIPAHWEMKRIKDCGCEVVDCKNRTPELHDDGDYFVVRTSCVKDGRFDPEPGYRTNEANFIEWTAKGKPQAGDVLFTREAPTGEACLAPEGLDFCLGQRMMYIRPPKHVLLSEFLLFSIYGGLARERISEKSKGSTVGHLRVGEVGELPLLLPPLEEQRALVDFVGTELSRLESLAAEAERAITLMKERRGALITAAVTGQVDVRNEIAGVLP
jgi:type I restriction enzyme S subunit